MEFSKLIKVEENTIIGYFVFRGNSLGYLFPYLGQLGLGVLGAKISQGGINWKNGPFLITESQFKCLRKATQQDFDDFRVSSEGHILT